MKRENCPARELLRRLLALQDDLDNGPEDVLTDELLSDIRAELSHAPACGGPSHEVRS